MADDGSESERTEERATGDGDDLESLAEAFVEAIEAHRHWERDPKELPA